MIFLYALGVRAYRLGIALAALFNPKARQWLQGRKGWRSRLSEIDLKGCIWMHAASTGEFEQGLPVLEKLKERFPERKILVTFFSPSGFNAKKDHPIADHVEYLPLDTTKNATDLIEMTKPALALFVKYEFWYFHLRAANEFKTPTYLISGIFREAQPFFKWYGATHRSMLRFFNRLFVQDERSIELLKAIEIEHVELSGDTRFDRVMDVSGFRKELPLAKAFERASDLLTIVAGSTWPKDEEILLAAVRKLNRPVRLIIAPHELGDDRLNALESKLPGPTDRWSRLNAMIKGLFNPKGSGYPEVEQPPNSDPLDVRSLLVDEIGLLSRLYRYGDISYVGGGFGSGIHNSLEPAAHGKPVLFGPEHERFAEANGLIEAGAAWSVKNVEELHSMLQQMLDDMEGVRQGGSNARRYVEENAGATRRIVQVVSLGLTGP